MISRFATIKYVSYLRAEHRSSSKLQRESVYVMIAGLQERDIICQHVVGLGLGGEGSRF